MSIHLLEERLVVVVDKFLELCYAFEETLVDNIVRFASSVQVALLHHLIKLL